MTLNRFGQADLMASVCGAWGNDATTPEKLSGMFGADGAGDLDALELLALDFLSIEERIDACASNHCVLSYEQRQAVMAGLMQATVDDYVGQGGDFKGRVSMAAQQGDAFGQAELHLLRKDLRDEGKRGRRMARVIAVRCQDDSQNNSGTLLALCRMLGFDSHETALAAVRDAIARVCR